MAEVNIPSWSEISQASEGLQLNSTATWEHILARLARLETRLVEHKRRVAATLPPLQPEPDPPDQSRLYTAAQPPHALYQPPLPPYQPYTWQQHNPCLGTPPWQPDHTVLYPSIQLPLPQRPLSWDPHEYQPDYLKAYQPCTQLPHADRQPYARQQPTSYHDRQYNLHLPAQSDLPPNTWPHAYSGSCWLPPPPTHVETPATHLSQPQHDKFLISTEPISDSSNVEMPIIDAVRIEELPPIDVIKEEDGSIAEGFDNSTKKILDSSARLCGLEKLEKKIGHEYESKKTQIQMCKEIEYSTQLNASRLQVLQAWEELINSLRANTSKDLLTDSWHVSDVARVSHHARVEARLIPPCTFLGIHGRVAFDPGGVSFRSPKFLFVTLFVASWFPP